MASLQMDMLKFKGTHEVGHIASTSKNLRTVINGGIVKVTDTTQVLPIGTMRLGLDNFTVGQISRDKNLAGNDDFGVVVSEVDDATATSYNMVLICTPEERLENEPLSNFFNANGDRATLYPLNQYIAFDTSAFTKYSGTPEVGDVAYWDASTKKFIITDTSDPKFTSAPVKFAVIQFEDNTYYTIDDRELVSLETLL